MKKKLLASIGVVVLVGSASISFAGRLSYSNGGGITDSPHNMPAYLQAKGASPGTSQLCVFCHTPHNSTASGEAGYNPLWNHKMDATGFIPYEGIDLNDPDYGTGVGASTFNAIYGFDPSSPVYDVVKGPSRLCMSCHDGVTAIDAYTKNGNGTVTLDYADAYDKKIMISEDSSHSGVADPYGRGSKDLRNDHPIGFSYKDVFDGNFAVGVSKDDNIRNYALPVTGWLGAGKTSIGQIKDVLFQGDYLTCASCHDVHNTDGTVTAGGSFAKPLLRVTTDGSALCLMCHAK